MAIFNRKAMKTNCHLLVTFLVVIGCVVTMATGKPISSLTKSQDFVIDAKIPNPTDHLPDSYLPSDEITPEDKINLRNIIFSYSRLSTPLPNFTCNDVQRVHVLYPKVSLEGILGFVLELLETESYDPTKELILTQNCPADQGVFNNITVFLLNESILFNLLALFIVLMISVLIEFCGRIHDRKKKASHADVESGSTDDEKNTTPKDQGRFSWIPNLLYGIWGRIKTHLKDHCETDELVLLSFQLCLIAILIPSFLMVITVLLIGVFATWNVIRTAVCLWVVFVYSVAVFYFHGSRNKTTIAGNSKTSNRTLLISRIHPDSCTESFLRSYYLDNNGDIVAGVNLIYKLGEKSPSLPPTAAFVTFKTREQAKSVINQPSKLNTWTVEWAPPPADIVWSSMHKKGSIVYGLVKIIQYFFIVLLPLVGSTIVVESLKLLVEQGSTLYYVLIYSKSIMTMFFIAIVRICPIFKVDHLKKSSAHLGVFLSSLIIIVVSEIVLPMLNFKDIWNSIVWTRTDPIVVNHWIRLQCIFRPDLGSEMAISVIEWNLFHSFFVLSRVQQWATRTWHRLRKRPSTEDNIPRKEFDFGDRYSQLVAQFVITCVGYFTYPPIIPITVLCLVVGYLIDRYTMVQTFKPTYSGSNIHRWAISFVLIMLAIQSALLFFKNVLMVEAEASLIGDSAIIALCVGLYSLFCIISIAVQFLFFLPARQPQYETITEADESQDYIRPTLVDDTLTRPNITKRTKRKPEDTQKARGIFNALKIALFTFVVPIIVAGIIVTLIRFTHVPKVAYSKSDNVSLTLNANLRLYTGRVPFTIMTEVCQKDASWLTIDSKCSDILVDNVVRKKRSSIFAKTNEDQRLLWTGGFFNLTTGDEWRWLDDSAKTYKNFCSPNETENIIAKAREESMPILYIVKDYRGDKFNKNGLACWQIYNENQLADLGFSFPADKTPRLPFACREKISNM